MHDVHAAANKNCSLSNNGIQKKEAKAEKERDREKKTTGIDCKGKE